jgi:acetyl-CoA carboxylase biotin carboxyl carrier protein
MIDLSFIKRLIETVESSNIDSLEYSRWGTKIRITKSPPVMLGGNSMGPTQIAVPPAANPVAGAAALPAESATSPDAAAPADTPVADTSGLVEVTSPMVGTFYRAPAPDADPFIDVGDRVRIGQTLCILEAMKLMNELEAEVSGTIKEIAVDNAEPVEYGQVLFLVLPD